MANHNNLVNTGNLGADGSTYVRVDHEHSISSSFQNALNEMLSGISELIDDYFVLKTTSEEKELIVVGKLDEVYHTLISWKKLGIKYTSTKITKETAELLYGKK